MPIAAILRSQAELLRDTADFSGGYAVGMPAFPASVRHAKRPGAPYAQRKFPGGEFWNTNRHFRTLDASAGWAHLALRLYFSRTIGRTSSGSTGTLILRLLHTP